MTDMLPYGTSHGTVSATGGNTPMTDITHTPVLRTYGCSFGCGNPFDYILIDQESSETMFLCLPCFLRMAQDIGTAVLDPDNETVRVAVEQMPAPEQAPMTLTVTDNPEPRTGPFIPPDICPECGAMPNEPHADDCYFGI